MIQENSTCYFENDKVTFISNISSFSEELYKEYDSKANLIGIDSKIDDLFKGKKVNYTEGLAAWHAIYRKKYSLKKNLLASNKNDKNKTNKLFELCKTAKNIITIGIGGSFEGPKMLLENINTENEHTNFIFITGSDSLEFKTKVKALDPKETIFLISSKSFTTDETISLLKDAMDWSGDLEKFIAITANKEEAQRYNISNIIEFHQEIGGRYSIWSQISILMYWFDRVNFDAFMAGGFQADKDLEEDDSYKKFVKHLAYSDIWLHNSKKKNSRAVLSYIWNWRSFPGYIQQLEMESLGKQPPKESNFKKTGQVIFGGYGPTAQHSYFQLLHQGTQEICADIITSKKDNKSLSHAQAITQSNLLSQGSNALKGNEKINGNIPTNVFLINTPGLYELGYLIATWEHRVFITATMLGINPFDQFGVNAGKFYTKRYLSTLD